MLVEALLNLQTSKALSATLPGDDSWARFLLPFARTMAQLEAPVRLSRYWLMRRRVLDALSRLHPSPLQTLRRQRLVRRVYRRWKRRLATERVDTPSPSIRIETEAPLPQKGFLVAAFHSPWHFVFLRELGGQNGPLVFAEGHEEASRHDRRVQPDLVGLRHVVRHLRSGGQAVLTIDHFPASGGRKMTFLGFDVHASRGAAEIAKHAKVPIVPSWLSLVGTTFILRIGRAVQVGGSSESAREAHHALLDYFEGYVEREPEGWRGLSWFLRERHALA